MHNICQQASSQRPRCSQLLCRRADATQLQGAYVVVGQQVQRGCLQIGPAVRLPVHCIAVAVRVCSVVLRLRRQEEGLVPAGKHPAADTDSNAALSHEPRTAVAGGQQAGNDCLLLS